MSARLLVLGIDAANPDLVRAWAADGTMPTLGRLFATGAHGTVQAAHGFFPATWPCIYTGCSPAEHGFHYGLQLRSGSYELYAPGDGDLARREPFWRALGHAGRRVAILDVPMVQLDEQVNGIHLVEWGGHDAIYGMASTPPWIADEILRNDGRHPQPPSCDLRRETADDYRIFIEALEQGAAMRSRFARRLLAREPWDLFLHVFSEAHCVGHQCWHLHDPTHPAHDEALAQALGDPLRRVYRAIDRAIGEILEEAGDANIVVFSGHGMGHWYGAHFLLRDILVRLGVTIPAPLSSTGFAERALLGAWQALPEWMRESMRRGIRSRRASHEHGVGTREPTRRPIPGVDAAASRCFPLANGLAATGIRLNLVGREPAGRVAPGAEARALEDELSAALLELVDERTGRGLVREVVRTRERYRGRALDALPDLLVEWSDDVATGSTSVGRGAAATVRAHSPRLGRFEGTNDYCRTGEHRDAGFIVAAGAGIARGPLATDVSVMDLAPTFAAILGVTLDGIDGVPVPALVSDRVAADPPRPP